MNKLFKAKNFLIIEGIILIFFIIARFIIDNFFECPTGCVGDDICSQVSRMVCYQKIVGALLQWALLFLFVIYSVSFVIYRIIYKLRTNKINKLNDV